MAFGLNCLIKSTKVVRAIGAAMRSISDTILEGNSDAKITVKDLHDKLKKSGVDIDMESTAAIYSDVFANDIVQYKNFETDEQLLEYKKKYPPVSAEVKKALIDAGYKKVGKDGKEILDWTKLMRKTEDEIKDEIKSVNLKNEDDVFNSLQGEWKQIISTAIIKAKNSLEQKNKESISKDQKNAIDKIADLSVTGLFSNFQNDYSNALHKAVGANISQLESMDIIDKVAQSARLLQKYGVGTNNVIGRQMQDEINQIISKARYKDANWFYKVVKAMSNVLELANLSTLNNLGNRGQNTLSGKVGIFNSKLSYGSLPKEIKTLAKSAKRDSILNGGVDEGDVSNMFNGDRVASEKVRKMLNNFLTKDGKNRAVNWWFSQIMGTAALNGIDNSNKVKNTWMRFINGAQDILVSKGMSRENAKRKLHEEIFGRKWEKSREKAENIMLEIQKSGAKINITKESIERFTGDIAKAELINNNILTKDELNAAWEAGYKSAGLEMGHVANNPLSERLNGLKRMYQDIISVKLQKMDYTGAAWTVLKDMAVNKIFMRFAGGGTNWMVLKLEKGGLGIVTGGLGKLANSASYSGRRSISQMSSKEIEENIYNRQKVNDRLVRGFVGATVNTALLLLTIAAFSGDDGDDRKKKVLDWIGENRWVNKYINNYLPIYLSAYLAWNQQQEFGGMSGMGSPFKYSPLNSYIKNLFNQNDNYSFLNTSLSSMSKIASDDEEKSAEGLGELGKLFGNYFNFDPLPYRVPKDVATIYMGITGELEAYKKPKTVGEGLLKFGITDWPKRP